MANAEASVTTPPYNDEKFVEELDRLTNADIDSFERDTIVSNLQDNVSPASLKKAKDALQNVVKPHELDFASLKLGRQIDTGVYETVRTYLRDELNGKQ